MALALVVGLVVFFDSVSGLVRLGNRFFGKVCGNSMFWFI